MTLLQKLLFLEENEGNQDFYEKGKWDAEHCIGPFLSNDEYRRGYREGKENSS